MRGWSDDWAALFASMSTSSAAPRLGVDYVQASAPCTSVALADGSTVLQLAQELDKHGVAGVVWNCARAMVAFFQAESHLVAGRHVLELGAGPGALGLALAADCDVASLLLTDLANVVPFTTRNARSVGQQHTRVGAMHTETGRLDVQELCWGERLPTAIATRALDVVLASDCLYEPKTHAALLSTLLELTHASRRSQQQPESSVALASPHNVVVFLAYKQRVPTKERPFFEAAAEHFAISVYSATGADGSEANNSHASAVAQSVDDTIFICRLERRLDELCTSDKAEPKG